DAPLAGAVMETVGGVLSSVTLIVALVVILPAASRAIAESVCASLAAAPVSQEMAYGDGVSSASKGAPSSKNCTPTTPTLSVALAPTVTAPDPDAPLAGAVMETVGGVLSTVTLTLALVVVLPAASRATAESVCAPSAPAPVSQET